jgi:hypothetical protein
MNRKLTFSAVEKSFGKRGNFLFETSQVVRRHWRDLVHSQTGIHVPPNGCVRFAPYFQLPERESMNRKTVLFITLLSITSITKSVSQDGNFLGSGAGQPLIRPDYRYAIEKEYRIVNGNVLETTSGGWHVFDNQDIVGVELGGIILNVWEFNRSKFVFLKNAPQKSLGYAEGQRITAIAYPTGTIETSLGTIEKWDCGTPCEAPPPSQAELKKIEDARQAEALKIQQDKQRILDAESRAIESLKADAQSGSSSAQIALGEHYLSGDWVKQDKSAATFWLKQASNQGSLEASNKLAEIK